MDGIALSRTWREMISSSVSKRLSFMSHHRSSDQAAQRLAKLYGDFNILKGGHGGIQVISGQHVSAKTTVHLKGRCHIFRYAQRFGLPAETYIARLQCVDAGAPPQEGPS